MTPLSRSLTSLLPKRPVTNRRTSAVGTAFAWCTDLSRLFVMGFFFFSHLKSILFSVADYCAPKEIIIIAIIAGRTNKNGHKKTSVMFEPVIKPSIAECGRKTAWI